MFKTIFNYYSLVIAGLLFVVGAHAQGYTSLGTIGEIVPEGGDVCPGATVTFRVDADHPDMGLPIDNVFEWVVYGGNIVSYTVNGSVITPEPFQPSITVSGAADIDNPYSTITVLFENPVPAEPYVAVRQSSEYGCTDNKWSVFLMDGDVDPPTITNFPADVPHLAWELRENYSFTIPTIDDVCNANLSFSLTVNGVVPEEIALDPDYLLDNMGELFEIDLLGEADGDVNDDGIGVDNEVVFTWSDGVNETSRTWNIHVDYRPNVDLINAIDPACIGDANGEILLAFDIQVENTVIREMSINGGEFTEFTGSLISLLPQAIYSFRVSTLVNGYPSTSGVLDVPLTDPPPIVVTDPSIAIDHEDCIGSLDGSISVSVDYTDGITNPFRNYSLSWTRNGTPFSPADAANPIGLGAATYQLTVTDAEGCFIRQTYTLLVNNLDDPTFDADASAMSNPDPLDLVANGYVAFDLPAGLCYYQVPDNSFNPSAIDGACGTNGLTLTHDYTGTAADPWADATSLNGARFGVGTTPVTWTATDATGNTATRIYNVYITDNIPPSIIVEEDTEYPFCEPDQTIPLPTVSDNCEIATLTCNFTPDVAGWDESYNWWPHIVAGETNTSLITFDITRVTQVEWIVTDVNTLGNSDTYDVSFSDPISPTLDYLFEPVTCYGDVDGGLIIDFMGGTTPYRVTVGSVFDESGAGTHYELTDLVPNDYTITITDADGCFLQWDIEVNEPTPIVIALNSLSDNVCFEAIDGVIDISVSGGNWDTDPGHDYTYTWSGPEAYAYADGHPWYPTPVVDFTGSTDELTNLPTGTYNLSISDWKGCIQEESYYIDATDTEAPSYDIDYSFTRQADADECTYTVQDDEFDPQNIADDCNWRIWHNIDVGDYGVTSIHTFDGAVFPVGTYDVVWTISDLNGNKEIELVTYTIEDDQVPVITKCPDDVNMSADPGQCSAIITTVVGDLNAGDNCSISEITFLRSDYFWAGLDYPFDARPQTETITWTVTDASGNTASCVQNINVSDTELPTVVVLGDFDNPVPVYLLGNGQYTLLPENIDGGTTDNCSNLEALFVGTEGTPLVFTCDDIGAPIEVTLTARDISGMEASAITYVQVLDNLPPTLSTKPFTVELDENGLGTLNPADIYGGSYTDNCDTDGLDFMLSLTGNDGDPSDDVASLNLTCAQIGLTTVFLVGIDDSGNRAYSPATVTITDKGAPIIVLGWNEATDFYVSSQSPNTNQARRVLDPDDFDGGTYDECGADFTLTMDPPFVDCSHVRTGDNTVLVELVATDSYGNESRETINLRVRDNVAPVVVPRTGDITLVASANTPLNRDYFFADRHDNCGISVYGIHVDAANGTDRNLGTAVASYAGRSYYENIEFRCDNEGSARIYLYAADASGKVDTISFSTTVDSDLEITSMGLDFCHPDIDPPLHPAVFTSQTSGGAGVSTSFTYNWTTRSGFWVYEYWAWIFPIGRDYSNTRLPRYYIFNWSGGEEPINLRVTDANSCVATNSFLLNDGFLALQNTVYNFQREACVGSTVNYIAQEGDTYFWAIIDEEVAGEGTIVGPDNEQDCDVLWTEAGTRKLSATSIDNGNEDCSVTYIFNVTIHDIPNPVLSLLSTPNPESGYFCPITEVQYEIDDEYSAYTWNPTGLSGNIVSGGDLYNFYGYEWENPAVIPTDALVNVEVTDENGCQATSNTITVQVGDDVPPTLTLPANITTANIPGMCEGSVILRLRETTNYSDNCGDVETVEYRTRWRYDGDTDWGTVPWGDWNISDNASGNYDVGETQVEWRVTDYSGNPATGINTITINDIDLPGFTTSPLVFTFNAGLNCDYTHDGSTNMSLTGFDNCEIDRIWVTFDGDDDNPVVVDLITPDPTDGYYFDNSVTDVTWHIEDKAGNTNSFTYQVLLTDITEPVFAFGSGPSDAGEYSYAGSFDAGQRFYIFADNNETTHSLSIPATITDNCSMGDVTVTLTHNNGTQTVYGPFDVDDGTEDDVFTFNYSFGLGQTTVRWDFNDATGFHPKSVTHYVVFASQYDFGSTCPDGTIELDHVCNLLPDEFTGNATVELPTWFSWLRSNNILTFNVLQSAVLNDPDGTECLVSRERDITLTYIIQIQGDAVARLEATGECTQTYWYFIDNAGPYFVDNEIPVDVPPSVYDLELVCIDGADFTADITDWLAINAGINIADEVRDNCHTENFTIDNDYLGVLNGETCGAGSVTPVTFTVTDQCGQTSTYVANIVVNDIIEPYFTTSEGVRIDDMSTVLPEQTVNCHSIPPVPDVYAADDCVPNPTITFTTSNTRNADGTSGTCDDNTYELYRTWTVRDACNNSISHTQTLYVLDDEEPQWVEDFPLEEQDITVDCNSIPAAPVFTYTENCDINPTYSFTQVNDRLLDPEDPSYYNYTITRTWSVRDNCNPANVRTQIIRVVDDTAPSIDTEAADITVECDGAGNIAQLNAWRNTRGGAVASDACVSPLHFIWTNNYDADGWITDCGNAKSQEVTFTVTDPAGNSATTSATFTIVDTQAPTWSGVLVYSQGPYELVDDIPAAYTTVAQIEAAGVAVLDACSPADAGLTVTSVQYETVGAGCSFTVERTYTITDACGNAISTLTQNFIVLDGIDPEIVKPLELQTHCATDETDQSVEVSGLALTVDDITDNCHITGQWFIDNVGTGAIRYRVIHTTDNTRSIPWTIGNPDNLTFYEGTSEVYFRATDQNNNRVEKHVYTITITHTPVLSSITVGAGDEGFIGAANQPLKFSTHDYFITMENAANLSNGNAYWQIFDEGLRISPYTEGTDYSLTLTNSGNDVTATITFDGNMAVGLTYDLVFTEIHASSACPNQRSYTFTLNSPFDVDIDDLLDICPDVDDAILRYADDINPDGTGTTTEVTYLIHLVSDTYENNWSFDYAISIGDNGTGGNDASVASVSFTSNGAGMTAPTTETGNVSVIYNAGSPTTIITLTVTYNDIHGTTQLVTVALTNITGQFGEVDENTQLGDEDDDTVGFDANNDQNNVRHLIKNLPLPGNIGGE